MVAHTRVSGLKPNGRVGLVIFIMTGMLFGGCLIVAGTLGSAACVVLTVGSDILGSAIVSVALTSGVVISEKISDNCLNARR